MNESKASTNMLTKVSKNLKAEYVVSGSEAVKSHVCLIDPYLFQLIDPKDLRKPKAVVHLCSMSVLTRIYCIKFVKKKKFCNLFLSQSDR